MRNELINQLRSCRQRFRSRWRLWLYPFITASSSLNYSAADNQLALMAQLNKAIRDGNVVAAKSAIQAGANLRSCTLDHDGFHTPLELAVARGNNLISRLIRESLQAGGLTSQKLLEADQMHTESRGPLVFQGELDAEESSFSCVVDRLIVDGNRAAIQMTCVDDGGPHTAEGSFELEDSTWRTRAFSVRYRADGSFQSATFQLDSLEVSQDGQSITLEAEWNQAGESFSIEGILGRFTP